MRTLLWSDPGLVSSSLLFLFSLLIWSIFSIFSGVRWLGYLALSRQMKVQNFGGYSRVQMFTVRVRRFLSE